MSLVGLHARGLADAREDFLLQAQEFRRVLHVLLALGRQRHLVDGVDAAGARRHQHHAIGEIDRLLDVVGDEGERRLFQPVHVQDEVVHDFARLRVERAEGLVHQQDFGPPHQRAGDGDALLHAAGQLVGVGVGGSVADPSG